MLRESSAPTGRLIASVRPSRAMNAKTSLLIAGAGSAAGVTGPEPSTVRGTRSCCDDSRGYESPRWPAHQVSPSVGRIPELRTAQSNGSMHTTCRTGPTYPARKPTHPPPDVWRGFVVEVNVLGIVAVEAPLY